MGFQKALVLQTWSAVRAAALISLLTASGYAAVNGARVSPSNLSFGNSAVGAKSATQVVTVTNGGRVSVQIQSLSFSSPQFTYSGPALPLTLGAGKSFSGSIQFLPTAAQKYSARPTFSAKQSLMDQLQSR